MPSTSYIDADGIKRYRSVQGAGTVADPFVADVRDATGSTGIGGQSDDAATTTTQTASLISLFKGFWTAFGLISEAASTTGSLMQRVRAIADRIGSFGDAASFTGSILAALRGIGESMLNVRVMNSTAVSFTATAGTDVTLITPTSGKSLRISTILLYSSNATPAAVNNTFIFKRSATAISGTIFASALNFNFVRPIALSANQTFVVNCGVAATIGGTIIWYED